MQTKQWWVRSSIAMSVFAAAGLMTTASIAADTQRPSTTADTGRPSTVAPARVGEDDATEFARLDKNKDGFIDKGEAVLEPKLLGKWAEVDTNKDGKISKEEFLVFERKEHAAKRQ